MYVVFQPTVMLLYNAFIVGAFKVIAGTGDTFEVYSVAPAVPSTLCATIAYP